VSGTCRGTAGLSRAARRDVRRKLRSRGRLDVHVAATGPEFGDASLRAELYRLYRNVYDQSEIHFDLLMPGFFDAVLQDASIRGVVSLYRTRSGLIGFNLCFVEGAALVDKYVGFRYPEAREHDLYAVSWIDNLEYAAARGLSRVIAGWTDPEIKRHLGASFTFTRHAVHARNPLLRAALRRFAGHFERDRAWFDARAAASARP
jgi:predicted N-acyltransferase